jgi:hypothetical protein
VDGAHAARTMTALALRAPLRQARRLFMGSTSSS